MEHPLPLLQVPVTELVIRPQPLLCPHGTGEQLLQAHAAISRLPLRLQSIRFLLVIQLVLYSQSVQE